jgi:hypothetical protein
LTPPPHGIFLAVIPLQRHIDVAADSIENIAPQIFFIFALPLLPL